MQYCVRPLLLSLRVKNTRKKINILDCVQRIGRLTVEAGTVERCAQKQENTHTHTHRNKIYEYQEKLWSACFCNEQHETKLIIEFIIVFFRFIHHLFILRDRFFDRSCFFLVSFFSCHQWLLALTVWFSFRSFFFSYKYKFHVFPPLMPQPLLPNFRPKKYA